MRSQSNIGDAPKTVAGFGDGFGDSTRSASCLSLDSDRAFEVNASMSRSARGYDRLAPWYQSLEGVMFGPKLHRSRTSLLGDIEDVRCALFFGDGDGRLLNQFCLSHPECDVVSVDQSAVMIAMQQEQVARVGACKRVKFLQRSACSATFAEEIRLETGADKFDLLVWPYFLDCFTAGELESLVPEWLSLLKDSGLIYFVDFVQPSGGFKGWVSSAKLTLMHGFFRWQTGLPNRKLVNLPELIERFPVRLIKQRDDSPMITSRLYRQVSR